MPRREAISVSAQLARNLSRLRERSRMTQEQLAEASDLSWRYVQTLEAGSLANPSLRVLSGLKRALCCTWDELLGGVP